MIMALILLKRRFCAVVVDSAFAAAILATVLVLWKGLKQIPPEALVGVLGENVGFFVQAVEVLSLPAIVVFVVLGLFSFFGFMCFFMSAVRENRPELAWLRVIGFTRWSVLRLVIFQGIVVAMWVVFFGVAVGYVLLFLLQDAFAGEVLLLTMPQMWEIMVCGIVFVGMVLASLWPAMMAARIHVDDVLGRL